MAAHAMDRFGFKAGMDVPVHERHTTSYGRGWQLLRSRGITDNATEIAALLGKPCDPPQKASTCACSERSTPWRLPADEPPLPRCVATTMCGSPLASRPLGAAPAGAAIVLSLDLNSSRVRFYYGRSPAPAYAASVRLVARLALSLRAVGSRLPIRLLASGFRSERAETVLAGLGVQVTAVPGPSVPLPGWASRWAAGSFSALRALQPELLPGIERAIYLDLDTVALRNLDHLADSGGALPAATFGFKCWPRPELRSAVMVLRPSANAVARALAALSDDGGAPAGTVGAVGAARFAADDNGVQSVWRQVWQQVHELPTAYAALRSADLSADEWSRVVVLHDPNLLRKAKRGDGFRASGIEAKVRSLDREAEKAMAEVEAGRRRWQPRWATAAEPFAGIQLFDQRRCRVAPPAQAGRLWLGPRRGLVRCADHVLGHSTSAGCGRVLDHSVCVHVCTYMRVLRCLFVIYAQRPIALTSPYVRPNKILTGYHGVRRVRYSLSETYPSPSFTLLYFTYERDLESESNTRSTSRTSLRPGPARVGRSALNPRPEPRPRAARSPRCRPAGA